MCCILYQRKDVGEDHAPPSCAIPLQLALFLFTPWVIAKLSGEGRKPPYGYPRCFLAGQAMDAVTEMEVYHQGPTSEKKGHQAGCPQQLPIPSWSQGLITNNRCQSGDRHRDEKTPGEGPHSSHTVIDVITAVVTAKGGRC